MDPTYPLVPIANFIAFVLTLIPLLHVSRRPWNAGVFVFALWLSLICLSTAINTIVWSNDVEDRAPVWCDICKPCIIFYCYHARLKYWLKATHLSMLVNTGIPACSLIITRRLYKVTRLQSVISSKSHVRKSS